MARHAGGSGPCWDEHFYLIREIEVFNGEDGTALPVTVRITMSMILIAEEALAPMKG